jgi:nucleoside-diphosphate-sugar epimerase
LFDGDRVTELIRAIAPTHLLHTAWDVTHNKYWTASANLDWLQASKYLLSAFFAQGGRRAIGVGSCAEYDWTATGFDEYMTPLKPATDYGKSKVALFRAFESHCNQNASTAWARLFFPFGPGEQVGRLLPSVITSLLNGRPADCTAGHQVRDFLYVADVGRALAAILDSGIDGPINIGTGHGIYLRDLIMATAEQVGRPDLVRLGALPMRDGDPPFLVAETRRLRHEVGFVPTTSLREAIGLTISYWTDQLRLTRGRLHG